MTEHAGGRRWLLALGVAVVVVQVALVVTTFVPAPHNGGDNAGYITLARSLLEGRYVDLWDSTTPPHTKYPPVFPAVLAVWIAAGARTWSALKTVPALFTVLSVGLTYLWAARRRGPLFGAAVAVLFGVSRAVLWSSHWILSDPTFLALTLLALVALDRADGERAATGPSTDTPSGAPGWIVLAIAATVSAYFTRSAGLPLLAALAVWLGIRRRWRSLSIFAAVAGIPALLWWLRARAVGSVQYVNEFWMLDPYQPELGRVGLSGLVARAGENLQGYVSAWVPQGLVGSGGPWVALLGLVLAVLALAGWIRRARRQPGGAELFLPLYAGLILLWPPVWSGDRFALPIFPLLLFYAGDVAVLALERWGRLAVRVGTATLFAAVAIPSLASWSGAVREATACAAAVRAAGPWACYGPPWGEFAEAARWTGANLPPGSAVLTRKPRLFYVMGGVPGRTFPFTTDPDAFQAEAADAGARYVLLDHVDAQATRYVGEVIRARPGAFCSVRAFSLGPSASAPSQLLGVVDPASGEGGSLVRDTEGRLAARVPTCPAELMPATEVQPPPLDPSVVPLLVGGKER